MRYNTPADGYYPEHKCLGYAYGKFYLDGRSTPRIIITKDVISIGCKEITLEAFDKLSEAVQDYRNQVNIKVVQE